MGKTYWDGTGAGAVRPMVTQQAMVATNASKNEVMIMTSPRERERERERESERKKNRGIRLVLFLVLKFECAFAKEKRLK